MPEKGGVMNKKRKPADISQKDWNSVNSPALTRTWFKRARPAREVDPKLVAAHESGKLRYRGQRGPQKTPIKERISIRLSRDVVTYFKSMGDGWQTSIDRALIAFVEAAK
jgi:uncharacterized protein (DUF4415 family)